MKYESKELVLEPQKLQFYRTIKDKVRAPRIMRFKIIEGLTLISFIPSPLRSGLESSSAPSTREIR